MKNERGKYIFCKINYEGVKTKQKTEEEIRNRVLTLQLKRKREKFR